MTDRLINKEQGDSIIAQLENISNKIDSPEKISDAFSPLETYEVGEYCIYENGLYKCTTQHTGAWNNAHFTATKVMDEMESKDVAIWEVLDPTTTPTTVDYAPLISIGDALGVKANDVKVKIDAVQSGSGTPSPTNIRPITGWDEVKVERCGKNLASPPVSNANYGGLSFNIVPDGVSIVGTTTAEWAQNSHVAKNYFTLKAGVQYIFSVQSTDTTTHLKALIKKKSGGNLIQIDNNTSLAVTVAEDTEVAVFNAVDISGYTINTVAKNMIRLASDTDDTFEPYQGNTYTIDLNGTRYGGVLDVTSGELTLTHGYADLGDLSWSKYGTSTAYDRYISNGIDAYAKENGDGVCSHYPVLHTWQANALIIGGGGSRLSIFTTYGEYADATAFKASLSGAQLVYELATPQTIQLTPQEIKLLLSNNTLSANSGDIRLEYFGKTMGGIEGAIDGISEDVEELRKMKVAITVLGDDESGRTTASRAYTTGEYFYQDGKMYKVLTSIASGATFTVGTNCSQTTIFAELKALTQ